MLAGLAMLPAGCGRGEEKAAEQTANPDAPEGITVTNGRLLLPPVSGNPAAIYFDITNNSGQDAMIRSVNVDGAGMAMLHTTVTSNRQTAMEEVSQQPLHTGETLSFEPGGLHVMAGGLADTITPGSTVEVTLTFVGGDKVSFPAEVRAPGDAR